MGLYGSPELYPIHPSCPKCGYRMSLDIEKDRYYCEDCQKKGKTITKMRSGQENAGGMYHEKQSQNSVFARLLSFLLTLLICAAMIFIFFLVIGITMPTVPDRKTEQEIGSQYAAGAQTAAQQDSEIKAGQKNDSAVTEKKESLRQIPKPQLNEDTKAAAVLHDDRKADLTKIDADLTEYWQHDYKTYNGMSSRSLTYDKFPTGAYKYYSTLPRYGVDEFEKYLDDPYNRRLCEGIANALSSSSDYPFEAVSNAVAFVQSLDYVPDDREYPKYPIETVYEKGGDCEDTSLLLCGIVRELGYGSALIVYDDHCAVGILGENLEGSYFDVDNKRYYYVETTGSSWKIGQIPDKYSGRSAEIIEIN